MRPDPETTSTNKFVLDTTVVSSPRDHAGTEGHSFLLVLSGPQFGELFDLHPGREHVIGRSADVDVNLRDDAVSRRHAAVTLVGMDARIVDLGSSNGVFVEGQRVLEGVLRCGDRFQIGAHTTLKFVSARDVEAEAQRRLAESALYEPLTGLLGRRPFTARLSAEIASSRRHRRPLTLLMVDVDHFKQVNDTYGHAAGDAALQVVAQALRQTTRAEDVLARYGGEEFVILARDTAPGAGRLLAERVRAGVEHARCCYEGHEIRVTVSVGLSSVGGGAVAAERPEHALLEAADAALLRAKSEGRNRVRMAPPIAA